MKGFGNTDLNRVVLFHLAFLWGFGITHLDLFQDFTCIRYFKRNQKFSGPN